MTAESAGISLSELQNARVALSKLATEKGGVIFEVGLSNTRQALKVINFGGPIQDRDVKKMMRQGSLRPVTRDELWAFKRQILLDGRLKYPVLAYGNTAYKEPISEGGFPCTPYITQEKGEVALYEDWCAQNSFGWFAEWRFLFALNKKRPVEVAQKNELPQILKLVRAQWPQFTETDRNRRDLWLVAKVEDRIVGCASFHREISTGYVFLQDLVIEKSLRDKGLGRELVFAGIDTFLNGGEQLVALVSTMNRNAIGFYEHIGFKKLVAKEVKAKSKIGGKAHNRNCMAWGYTKSV